MNGQVQKLKKGEIKFKIPKVKHGYPLLPGEKENYRIKEKPIPVEWAKKHWKLTKVYAQKGKFIPHKWQKFLINLVAYVNTTLTVAPVRSGKTMIDQIKWGYCIDNYDMGGMIVFPNEKVVKKNFKLRVIPAIKNIPVLRKYWSGKDDDLTIENLILTNCLWGIASAWNKDDLATFGAQCVSADECSKWKKPRDFDPFDLLRGRQDDYRRIGEWRFFGCSSPFDVGDLYYNEIYRPGNIIITPHFPCSHCGELFEWSDHHIRENLPKDSRLRKDPIRILDLKELAVRYECPHCKQEITEDDRVEIIDNVVWAAPKYDLKNFKQDFQIVNDGTTIEPLIDLTKYEAVCPMWNKLIEPTYKFYRCLAEYFDSFRSPIKRKAYENEKMARFMRKDSKKRSKEYFLQRKFGYMQYGPDAHVPDGVLVVSCTFDTQDNGLYYIIRGWGKDMETWLIRHDFIDLPFDDEGRNKEKALEIVQSHFKNQLTKKTGEKIQIMFGLIDQGGHRAAYVKYFCDHIWWLHPYIGNPRINYKEPMIEKREKRNFYYGQTELLSEKVEGRIGKPNWHLPDDVTDTYLTQLVAQYWVTEYDEFGQAKKKMIKLPDDHLRDCENYQEGVVEILELEDHLFKDEGVSLIKKYNEDTNKEVEKPTIKEVEKQNEKLITRGRQKRGFERGNKNWLSVIHRRR